MDWQSLARDTLLGNSLEDWVLAALAFALTFTILPLLRRSLRARARRYAGGEQAGAVGLIAHLIERTSRLVVWTVALFAAERILTWPHRIDHLFDVLIALGIWFQIGLWLMAAVRFGLTRRSATGHDPGLAGSLNIVMFVARLIIWGVVLLLALGNLGVNITALVAGLGVGGIAIALAVQTILGDLFASLSIALDKPFLVGDLLRVDDCEGTVEQIGIKSTRLRSVTGEEIILSNTDLLKSRVRNLGRMQRRRGLFQLALAFDTPPDQLDRVPQLVADAVAKLPDARFEHCLLKEIGESALKFEVLFFIGHQQASDLTVALDALNRQILRSFAAAGIAFAYPTRTIEVRPPAAAATLPAGG
ncbi:MAG TPA: mechanosensitive ion channel family protein [Steroidobacteraceae bacterium]|nr:mechanosensitive ion channel family protein [Steroidobacteraceae bacterium]